MNAPTVYLSDVNLSYQNIALFAGLNLTLAAGKWTCLLGPSGVGKSSLLHLIAGLIKSPGNHSVTTSDHLPLTNRIAFMAQKDLLMPWYSLLDNVTLGARLRGEKSAEHYARAEILLNKVGLKTAINKKVSQLSGGMRQRVALARTLFEDKPVVLMDEPFASLDAITRFRLQELAAEMLTDRTVLFVTHDPLEALRLGDAVYVMTGLPATLGVPLQPPGKAPRDPADPILLTMQAELLHQLTQAQSSLPW